MYSTLKGLSKEGKEVREAFRSLKPDAVCVSLSDRELAEVRFALAEGGEGDDREYVPESRRRVKAYEDSEMEGDEEELEDGEGDEDEELDEVEPEAVPGPSGMVSTRDVHDALDEPFHPDLVAADAGAMGDRIFVSDSDMTYSKKLAVFGDVELPPPSFAEAVRLADRAGVPIVPVDLTDNEYTIVFCDHVSYWQLVRHSKRVRSMRRLRARSPEELMTLWDRRIRSLKGFDVLEGERELKMATTLVEVLERHATVLAVIDMPRVEGTLRELARRVRD